MAEAQPSKKRGGHAYGRRHKQISNTAEEGELCLYSGHSLLRLAVLRIAGIGKKRSIQKPNNHSLLGDAMEFHHLRNTILSGLLCGLLGGILGLQVSRPLVAISIAVILFISFLSTSEST